MSSHFLIPKIYLTPEFITLSNFSSKSSEILHITSEQQSIRGKRTDSIKCFQSMKVVNFLKKFKRHIRKLDRLRIVATCCFQSSFQSIIIPRTFTEDSNFMRLTLKVDQTVRSVCSALGALKVLKERLQSFQQRYYVNIPSYKKKQMLLHNAEVHNLDLIETDVQKKYCSGFQRK